MTVLLPLPRVREPSSSGPPSAQGHVAGPLRDGFGRVATDLRVSLTDRCNLRCTYCMPAEGLPWLPRAELLDDDELVRLIGIGVRDLGITSIRFTGGEPLLRRDLETLIARVAGLEPRPKLALTTNGIGLADRAATLVGSGLQRINVSLDTLDRETFRRLSRRDRLADVLAGVRAARAAGLDPVKINTVLLRGVNDHETVDLVRWAMAEDVQLRFIEQMPLDAQHAWQRSEMVTAAEIRERLDAELGLAEDPADRLSRGSAPAELFRVGGGEHRVGIIAAVTQPFCGSCDRVRLTADGQLRNCLCSQTASDLRAPLRNGADDDEIAAQWVRAVADKRAGHGIDDPSFLQPARPMSAIGG